MPAWAWIVAAAAAAFAALVTFGRGWWRVRWVLDWAQALSVPRWWYSWRRARHVLAAECNWCGPGKRCTCRREADPDFYGSMTLAGERDWRGYTHPMADGWLPAPPEVAHGPDWREQTAADLAPEALDRCISCGAEIDHHLGCPDDPAPDYEAEAELHADPGPGDLPSLDPGPDQSWRDEAQSGMIVVVRDGKPRYEYPHEPSRLADTGDVMDAHLLADVQAYMRAQDDDARADCSARALGWAGFMRDLEAALA